VYNHHVYANKQYPFSNKCITLLKFGVNYLPLLTLLGAALKINGILSGRNWNKHTSWF